MPVIPKMKMYKPLKSLRLEKKWNIGKGSKQQSKQGKGIKQAKQL